MRDNDVLTIIAPPVPRRIAFAGTDSDTYRACVNRSNSIEDVGVSNQEEIIRQGKGMDMRDLMDLVIEHPFLVTDSYHPMCWLLWPSY